jgi:AcrR family transcriptional regulator
MAFPSKTSPEAIRAAAIELLEREGESALTLRRIARALGVVPNALYRYFDSREALMGGIADEAAARLLAAIRAEFERLDSGASAEQRCRAFMKVYIAFSQAHPWLYQTLLSDLRAAGPDALHPVGHEGLWRSAIETLAPLTGPETAPFAAVTLWSLLHGMWALRRANLLGGMKPEEFGDYAIETMLKGLRR